jgi:hypothetical protein
MGIENRTIIRRRWFEVKNQEILVSIVAENRVKLLVEDDQNGFQWKLVPGKLWKVVKKTSDKVFLRPLECKDITEVATPDYGENNYKKHDLTFSIPKKEIAEWFDKLVVIRQNAKRKPKPITPTQDGLELASQFSQAHPNRFEHLDSL